MGPNPVTLSTYDRYRLGLITGAGSLVTAGALAGWFPNLAAPIIFFAALSAAAWVWTFLVRCPRCGAGLLRTSTARIASGKLYLCARCGLDLRAVR